MTTPDPPSPDGAFEPDVHEPPGPPLAAPAAPAPAGGAAAAPGSPHPPANAKQGTPDARARPRPYRPAGSNPKRRSSQRSRAEVDAIVNGIAEEMAAGKWVSGPSSKKWSAQLGCSRDYVRHLATMASRIVWHGDPDDLARLRATSIARLEHLSRRAEQGGAFHAAVSALDRAADIAGLKVPLERRINLVLEGLATSDEWQRLRAILTRAAVNFHDERDRALLLEAVAEFETGSPSV